VTAPAPARRIGGELLSVRGLVKHYPAGTGLLGWSREVVHAVDGVDLDVREGETVALVGESGSGKTTLGRCILRLVEPTAGSIRFMGEDLLTLKPAPLRRMRRHIQIVFQDPFSSLNPRMSIEATLAEPFIIHKICRGDERRKRIEELCGMVGLDRSILGHYPHQLSGGQRQRVGIARALALGPRLLVCDEPVSALDVSVRAQVINLLLGLQEKLGLAYLFVAHDLRLVEHLADRVAVMYLGKIVESAPAERLFAEPRHPYTKALLAAVPAADPEDRGRRETLPGDPPSPVTPPAGCRFHPRCPVAVEACPRIEPALLPETGLPEHLAACHLVHPPS